MEQEHAAVQPMFTRRALWKLMIPLIGEQFLAVMVGMADTVMVSSVGEVAVSGVSLVDQINMMLILAFGSLATGGAVVTSQYLGRKDEKNACRTAKQLVYLTFLTALVIGMPFFVFSRPILRGIYGRMDVTVLEQADIYMRLSALSYPFLAIYNAGAALFRSMGNSRVSLADSAVMNGLNIAGNVLLIYGLDMGVAGAGIATLFSRVAAAAVMLVLLYNRKNPVYIERVLHPEWDGGIIRSMLRVGVPSGTETALFQVGKLIVASLITAFGTSAVAANAICSNIGAVGNMPGCAIGLASLTVVGQCVGAADYKQARGYAWRLLRITYGIMGVLNVFLYLAAPAIVSIYQMPAETAELAILVSRVNCAMTIVFWPASFELPNSLRAAGDGKFTMVVSMISMWVVRVGFSYVLGAWCHLGLLGVWLAMHLDWIARVCVFVTRMRGDKWEKIRLIRD